MTLQNFAKKENVEVLENLNMIFGGKIIKSYRLASGGYWTIYTDSETGDSVEYFTALD